MQRLFMGVYAWIFPRSGLACSLLLAQCRQPRCFRNLNKASYIGPGCDTALSALVTAPQPELSATVNSIGGPWTMPFILVNAMRNAVLPCSLRFTDI